ncbi:MAG TPA: hypothetical protein VFE62_24670, partial [Gemmataceae bacterium]|nr:hypothetical protein [Gemmataceae bacterium]
QLSSRLRISARAFPERARARLQALDGVRVTMPSEQTIEVECRDAKGMLVQLVHILSEEQVALTGLESEEPNLERVFLHLTGRGLRDD